VKINGRQQYLWRAVDQDGEVVDVYLQARRDGAAAKRFFKRLIRSCDGEPKNIVTDRLRSYGVAHRELMPDVIHNTARYTNNWAEQLHESTRVRERGMRRFKSPKQAQRFLSALAQQFLDVAVQIGNLGVRRILLFLAAPNSVVFRFGRLYDKRNLPEIIVYQYQRELRPPFPWGISMPVAGRIIADVMRD
jgi:IS1 family transposase